MASSLQELLAEEGFETDDNKQEHLEKKQKQPLTEDRKKNDSCYFSASALLSQEEKTGVVVAIDEAAVRAVISILSGYATPFLKDERFRNVVRKKCYACLPFHMAHPVIPKLESVMESIEGLVEEEQEEMRKLKSLKNLIGLLSIVASSMNSHDDDRHRVSACAQLYLSFVCKLEKKDRMCARHLLQVFSDSPFLARTHLLPDLWERFFLPHLLHLKVWLTNQLESISSNSASGDGGSGGSAVGVDVDLLEKETTSTSRMKALYYKAYNDKMDFGTKQFACYYKQWLKLKPHPPAAASPPPISINKEVC